MARTRTFDARHLDLAAFAEAGGELRGTVALAAMPRLAADLVDTGEPPADVPWQARGQARPVKGGAAETWLQLQAHADVGLQCQRCLQPMRQALELDRWFRFAASEEDAARLDEESDDDVLVLSRNFDLLGLVEDELILALPLVPKHEHCPQPLPQPEAPAAVGEAEAAAEPERENPFAALAALRRRH